MSEDNAVIEPDEVLSEAELEVEVEQKIEEKVDIEQLVRNFQTRNAVGQWAAEFDQRRAQLAIDYVRAGNYTVVAAAAAGIDRVTLLQWLKDGQRGKTPALAKFSQDMAEAQSQAEAIAILSIQNAAANGSWQAAAWWLERKYSERFGRKDAIDINVTLREHVERLAARRGLPAEQIFQAAKRIYRELGE